MKAQSGMQRKDPTKAWTALNVRLDVDLTTNPSARAIVGQDKVVLFDFIGLDTTPSGGLDQSAGRNSKLRTYREALAMNAPGQPFAPRMMQGRQLLVKIKYGINPNSQEQQEEIAGVAAFKG
jgi:hypothetical protein